jgi:hypothetical protein
VPTSTTVPDFLAAFVPLMAAALPGVKVTPVWPGPEAQDDEMVFMGDTVGNWDVDIPTMKAGRKQRQESYDVTVEAWVGKPGELREASATAARTRAIELIDAIDDLLADTPEVIADIQHARLTGRGATLVPFEKGWACQATATISVAARLT